MKVTKRQLLKIIREEVSRVDEAAGVISGLGFGSHGTGVNQHNTMSRSAPSPAALAFSRSQRRSPLVQEYFSGDEEILLRRAVDSYVDGYMLKMSMNPGDVNDRQRIRRQVDDLVTMQLDAFLGED